MDRIAKLRFLGFTEEEIARYMSNHGKSPESSERPDVQCEEKRDNTIHEIPCVICLALNPHAQEDGSTPSESNPKVEGIEDIAGENDELSEEDWLEYEERASIMEYDGNLSREEAEKGALKLVTEKGV